MKDIDIYAPADKAIQSMNRSILRDFGKLKMAKFDEVHLIRTVQTLYEEQTRKARRRYYEVGFEAYLLALYLCGIDTKKAHQMAEKSITKDWVDAQLSEINLVTGYRFNTETERKAQRLTETLAAASEVHQETAGQKRLSSSGTDAEIDRAIRAWSKQVGQYALSITDAAVMEAYEDAAIEKGEWVSEKDQRVCSVCHKRDGQIYPLNEIPPKPHWGCRCKIRPVLEIAD